MSRKPYEAAPGAQPGNGSHASPQALLTKTLRARKANLMTLPIPGRDGIPKNAIVHGACGKWWTGAERSHASCCHENFSSLSAFDRHRTGGKCNPPETVGLVAREKPYGTLWGWPAPEGGYGRFYGRAADIAKEAQR